ncbi:hypothetical protein DFH09DRAFT_1461479 [Mycena vulgaris]|nr:hypothetical protein DFH09DRAFT_1461479 [Mycena vulgaris]
MRIPLGSDLYAFYVDPILLFEARKCKPASYATLPGTSLAQLNAFLVKNAGHSADAIGTRASTRPRVCPSAQDAIFHQDLHEYLCASEADPAAQSHDCADPRRAVGVTGPPAVPHAPPAHLGALPPPPTFRGDDAAQECARCQTVVYCCKDQSADRVFRITHQREDWPDFVAAAVKEQAWDLTGNHSITCFSSRRDDEWATALEPMSGGGMKDSNIDGPGRRQKTGMERQGLFVLVVFMCDSREDHVMAFGRVKASIEGQAKAFMIVSHAPCCA